MASVHIAIPNGGSVDKHVTMATLFMATNDLGHELTFNFQSDKPIDSSRNRIIRDFLKKDWDYLFFIDSDNGPYIEKNPLELVDLDKDIIALPTPIWHGKLSHSGSFPIIWNCFDLSEEEDTWREHSGCKGLQKIDAAGTGSMLIARRVLEEVRPAFARKWDKDGLAVVGSDLLFCKRAKEAGFEVYAHYDYPCHHVKQRDLADLYVSILNRDVANVPVENINTPDYWNEKHRRGVFTEKPYYDMVLERLNGGSILDYGCGSGVLLEKLGPQAMGMDFSEVAIQRVLDKGLRGVVGDEVEGRWDTIVCTEVLEEIEDDAAKLKEFFEHTDRVVYSVPYNCLPPGLKEENRRVYTERYIRAITPHLKEITVKGKYAVVVAEKE